ncbi:MAG: condensation domain-containing protein, partial [Thiolinea sp.]
VFELGVDSLMSIQLANRLAIDLGLALPSTLIMEYPSIQQLAEQLADELTLHATNASKPNHLKHADTAEVIPTNTMTTDAAVAWDIYDWFPQSYIQQLYYGWHEAAENKSFMNMNFVVRIRSVINSEHLQTATQMLLDRHADLRLVYDRQNGQPVQKARRHQPAFFVAQTIDCATWEEARPALLQASRQPFDLRHDSTMRVYLFSRTPDDHILLIVRHHIINDRTSAAIVLDELFTLYHAQATDTLVPAPAAPSYFEFLHWHNTMLASEQGQQLWQYWQQQLSGPLSVLDLPTDYPRHAKNRHHGGLVNFQLPATLVNSLRQLAKTHGVTLYAAMLTAFKLLLHFHTGQRDILVDTSMINRTHQQFEQTIGQLSIMHTLRTQIPAAVSFPVLLKTVQQTVWDALKHQSYPSQLLLERLAMPKSYVYNRPGQVLFNLVSSNLTQASLPSLGRGKLVLEPTRIIPSGSAGTFHEINTQLLEQEDGTITGHINYETDLYKLSTIEGLMRRYEVILQRLVADPQQTVTDLQNHYATCQDKEVA